MLEQGGCQLSIHLHVTDRRWCSKHTSAFYLKEFWDITLLGRIICQIWTKFRKGVDFEDWLHCICQKLRQVNVDIVSKLHTSFVQFGVQFPQRWILLQMRRFFLAEWYTTHSSYCSLSETHKMSWWSLSVLIPSICLRLRCNRDNSRNNILCWPIGNAALFICLPIQVYTRTYTNCRGPLRGDKAAWSWCESDARVVNV